MENCFILHLVFLPSRLLFGISVKSCIRKKIYFLDKKKLCFVTKLFQPHKRDEEKISMTCVKSHINKTTNHFCNKN